MTRRSRATIQVIGSWLLLMLAALQMGMAIRHELGPWGWQELSDSSKLHSPTDYIAGIALGAPLYSLGFFIPFWMTTFVFYFNRERANQQSARLERANRGSADTPMPEHHRRGRLLLSLSTLVLWLLLLEPVLAFLRALPSSEWLLILGLALAARLAFLAYVEFRGF